MYCFGTSPRLVDPKAATKGSMSGVENWLPVDVLLQHERGIALVVSGHQQVDVVHAVPCMAKPVDDTHERPVIRHQLQQ